MIAKANQPGVITYRDGYKYQLRGDYVCPVNVKPPRDIMTNYVALTMGGSLTIRDGYAWDGATLCPDFHSIIRGSLIHDALYQLMRTWYLDNKFRPACDEALHDACIADGMNAGIAWTIYKTVRTFGAQYAEGGREPKDLTAP